MQRFAIVTLGVFCVAGCASGPHYWTKPGATSEMFLADHTPCFRDATIGYGIGSERAYKACMRQKGLTRIQGSMNEPPKEPHFRGPEGDDEFAASSPDELMQRTLTEQQGVGHIGRDPRCEQPRNARAPGTVCR